MDHRRAGRLQHVLSALTAPNAANAAAAHPPPSAALLEIVAGLKDFDSPTIFNAVEQVTGDTTPSKCCELIVQPRPSSRSALQHWPAVHTPALAGGRHKLTHLPAAAASRPRLPLTPAAGAPPRVDTDHTIVNQLAELGSFVGFAVTIEVTTNDTDDRVTAGENTFEEYYSSKLTTNRPPAAARDV